MAPLQFSARHWFLLLKQLLSYDRESRKWKNFNIRHIMVSKVQSSKEMHSMRTGAKLCTYVHCGLNCAGMLTKLRVYWFRCILLNLPQTLLNFHVISSKSYLYLYLEIYIRLKLVLPYYTTIFRHWCHMRIITHILLDYFHCLASPKHYMPKTVFFFGCPLKKKTVGCRNVVF